MQRHSVNMAQVAAKIKVRILPEQTFYFSA
jgi:hypothetical protein